MATSRLRPAVTAIAALLLYALLIDTAIETYQARSPVAAWVGIPIALYVSFTLWLVRQGRGRSGLGTGLWVSSFLFLGLLAITASMPGGLTQGMRVAGYPTSIVLSATTIALIAFAVVSLTIVDSPLPVAVRIAVFLAGCYGLAGFVTGIASQRSYVELLQGHSLWLRAPYFLQGAFVGALVVVPFAFVIDLGVALARVQFTGRRHRLLVFALGTWMAYSALTLGG